MININEIKSVKFYNGVQVIPVRNRAQLIDDAFTLGR